MGKAGKFLVRSPLLLGIVGAVLAQAQPQSPTGQLDASPALFTVLAAINAAGYDADLDSNANSPVRKQVRDLIAAKHLDSVEALKKFFAAHRQQNPTAELNQYISFALTLDGPPDFQSRMKPEEIPLDVRPLAGLDHFIAEFYREAGIEDLWKRAQPAYDHVIAAYHSGITKALLEANAYVRNPTSGYRGRRFQVYVDLLGAPNQVQTRSYKDDYFVVVTPSPEPQVDQIRHAYLHYLLDPLALRHFEQLNRLKGLADFANPSEALDIAYKDDFMLLSTECVIKAVESRMARGASNRQALVDQAVQEGFVLTPALADGLAVYEKQEESLRLYYPDLIGQIDLAQEDKRLEKVRFAKQAAIKKAPAAPPPPAPVLAGAAKTLDDAEELYTKRDLERARQTYLKVLQAGETALHARAYYGLARIAALQKDPELAEKLFQKTLELSPDKDTESWAHLYLGRLADAAGDRGQAEKNYRAVLAIDGAPAPVKNAAAKELAQPFHREQ
ncbi:MAG TPA: tetratricopeptide repeat protein [Bryobacteraceae bacterium]|jgi:tetratricopeptide (TPR) repeat protein|nr:tetratricopeptide repeat protein [Bryobacteraceae bacterium]